jgi:hypothetical protein
LTLFADIVIALRNRLGKLFGGDVSRVVVVGVRPREGYPRLVGDRDILMRIRGFGVDQNSVAGAGERNTQLRRLIDLVLRSRRVTDPVSSDLAWFTAADGQLAFESGVIAAAQMLFGDPATEPDGRVYSAIGQWEPLRIVNGGDAVKDLFEVDGTWGSSVITVECVYREPITPPGEA